jgi:hypothetical protein
MKLTLPSRKSQLRRFVDQVNDSLDVRGGLTSRLPGVGTDGARKAGLVAGTLAGLTAGSAGISLLRRRTEGARDNS